MSRSLVAFVIVIVAGACGRPGPNGAAEPQAGSLTCESMASGVTASNMVEFEQLRVDMAPLEPQLVELCINDGWSVALRRCVDEGGLLHRDKCEPPPSPTQREHIEALLRAGTGAPW